MADIVKLSCPSCGSKLNPSDSTNHFVCDSCGSIYMFKQTGDSISLLPVTESNPNIIGNNNVVVRINNVTPTVPTTAEQVYQSNKSELSILENGECPICGRITSRTATFRCKNCQRSFICLSHQDKESFLCSDCTKQHTKNVTTIPAIVGIFLVILIIGAITLVIIGITEVFFL